MARGRGSAQNTKQKLLIGLGVVLVGVVIYQFFVAGPAPRPKVSNSNSNRAPIASSTPSGPAPVSYKVTSPAAQASALQELLADQTPLDLDSFSHGAEAPGLGSRGSIFAYYVAPPFVPPPKPPAPI